MLMPPCVGFSLQTMDFRRPDDPDSTDAAYASEGVATASAGLGELRGGWGRRFHWYLEVIGWDRLKALC